jgi:hypothetical protein
VFKTPSRWSAYNDPLVMKARWDTLSQNIRNITKIFIIIKKVLYCLHHILNTAEASGTLEGTVNK